MKEVVRVKLGLIAKKRKLVLDSPASAGAL